MSDKKRKRTVLDLEQKLDIINKIQGGKSVLKTASEYGLGLQTVRDIVKNKEKLEKFIQDSDGGCNLKKRKSLKGSSHAELDAVMIEWFQRKRAEGTAVSGSMCTRQANYFFKKLGLAGTFSGSSGWLKRFKQRHGIRELERSGEISINQGERSSEDFVGATLFVDEFDQMLKQKGLTVEQVYNADETVLHWRPTTLTSANEDGSPPGDVISKERITVLCCANATGNDKVPLAVIGKSKSPRLLKNVISHLPVNYYSQRTASVTRDVLLVWFESVFVPHVKEHLRGKGLPEKAVLILDSAPSHPPAEELASENGNIFAYYLPPNVASLVQPMSQGVIQTMKKIYEENFTMDSSTIGENEGPSEFGKFLNIREAIFSIVAAWQEVRGTTIEDSFGNVILPEDDEEALPGENADCAAQLQAIKGCSGDKEENIVEWFLADESELLNDDELAEGAARSGNAEDEDCEADENDNDVIITQSVSPEEALSAAETLLSYFENQDDFDFSETLHVRRFIKLIKQKRRKKNQRLLNIINKLFCKLV